MANHLLWVYCLRIVSTPSAPRNVFIDISVNIGNTNTIYSSKWPYYMSYSKYLLTYVYTVSGISWLGRQAFQSRPSAWVNKIFWFMWDILTRVVCPIRLGCWPISLNRVTKLWSVVANSLKCVYELGLLQWTQCPWLLAFKG